MRILRSADYRRMPWKNGGGETREVAAAPVGATMDTLDWRVSLASVAVDGPFSVFQGVQRTLCVTRGAGIELKVGDLPPATLYVDSEPYAFDGEASTRARLLNGPIEDLNVMSRRGRYRHAVGRLVLDGAHQVKTSAHVLIIYCQRGELMCSAGLANERLQADDCAIFDAPRDSIHLASTQTTDAIVIELHCAA